MKGVSRATRFALLAGAGVSCTLWYAATNPYGDITVPDDAQCSGLPCYDGSTCIMNTTCGTVAVGGSSNTVAMTAYGETLYTLDTQGVIWSCEGSCDDGLSFVVGNLDAGASPFNHGVAVTDAAIAWTTLNTINDDMDGAARVAASNTSGTPEALAIGGSGAAGSKAASTTSGRMRRRSRSRSASATSRSSPRTPPPSSSWRAAWCTECLSPSGSPRWRITLARMSAKAKLKSCCSGGGPVIGIAAELAVKWRGTLAPIGAVVPPGWTWGTAGGPVCDYDRACDKIEHRVAMPSGGFGSVPLDGGVALVFEGPLNTSWVPTDDGGVVIRNVDDDESVAGAQKLIAAIPAAKWKAWPGTITLRDGRICFWDSAMEGAADPKKIPTNDTGLAMGTPGPGTYKISTAVDDEEHEYVKLTRA